MMPQAEDDLTPESEKALLLERFRATFGTVADVVLKTRSRAIVGTDQLPDSEGGKLALRALISLRTAGAAPTPKEFAALEYMIRALRPAPLVSKGALPPLVAGDEFSQDQVDDFKRAFPLWNDFRPQFTKLSYSIGRISRVNPLTGGSDGEGTGFLVAEDVVMTNAHVLYALTAGGTEIEKGQAIIQFKCEPEMFDEDEIDFAIDKVIAIHPDQDACLLRLEKAPGQAPLVFAAEGPSLLAQVAAVGFPYSDESRNPAFIKPLFKNQFGFKRVAPGLVTGTQSRTATLYHDCSTLGGNSGSPVVSLADCGLVGLHYGGGFLWKNTAVNSSVLAGWVREKIGNA